MIFASGGSIWVQGTSPGATGGVTVNTLYRIDPSSNELVDTIDIGQQSGSGFAADQSGAWAAVPGGVQRFDTTTGSFVGSVIEVNALVMTSDGAAGAWIRVGPDGSHTTAFLHIDASGVIDRRVDVPPGLGQSVAGIAYAFDPSTGALWVVHYKDSISRVDLAG